REEAGHGLGWMSALPDPLLSPGKVDVELGRAHARIVVADRFDHARVGSPQRIRDDDSIERLVVGAHAAQSDSEQTLVLLVSYTKWKRHSRPSPAWPGQTAE